MERNLSDAHKQLLVDWLRDNLRPATRVCTQYSFPDIKRVVCDRTFHVTDGQFTDAMRAAGFAYEIDDSDCPLFYISMKSPLFRRYRHMFEREKERPQVR